MLLPKFNKKSSQPCQRLPPAFSISVEEMARVASRNVWICEFFRSSSLKFATPIHESQAFHKFHPSFSIQRFSLLHFLVIFQFDLTSAFARGVVKLLEHLLWDCGVKKDQPLELSDDVFFVPPPSWPQKTESLSWSRSEISEEHQANVAMPIR